MNCSVNGKCTPMLNNFYFHLVLSFYSKVRSESIHFYFNDVTAILLSLQLFQIPPKKPINITGNIIACSSNWEFFIVVQLTITSN